MSLPTPVEPTFVDRHIGPSDADQSAMLQFLGYDSLDSLMDAAVPHRIRNAEAMNLPPALSEEEAAAKLRSLADANVALEPMIGLGYYGKITPAVIRRNLLEDVVHRLHAVPAGNLSRTT